MVSAQTDGLSEDAIKAAFLFHFAQFVEWPAEALKGQNGTIVYCTIGEDEGMRDALQANLVGKTIQSRLVELRRLRDWQAVQGCQILFIGTNENKHLASGLATLKTNPVLTVGEMEHFVERGGMIGFCPEANKVRFEINLGAADRAKLKISAKLLSLAKTVTGRTEGTL